jgi:hypothetical protein
MTITIPLNTFNPLQTFDFYKGAHASDIIHDTYIDEKSQLQHTYVTSFKTSDFNYNVWMKYRYLRSLNGLSNPPPDTSEIQEDFRNFLSTYTSLDIGEEAMALGEPLLEGFYTTYMDSFCGNLPSLVKQDLWNAFLISQSLRENPADPSPALQAAFAAFIQQKQTLAYFYESQTALSPFEIQKRIILMQILNALSKYLDVTQQLVNVQAQLLIFYGKWQQEYTQAMTRVPSLSGAGLPGQIKVGELSSADAFTFGYADISLSDVIRWGYAQAKNTPGTDFTFGNAETGMGSYTFKVIKTGEKEDLTIRFQRHTEYTATYYNESQKQNYIVDGTATIPITPVLDSQGKFIPPVFATVVARAGEGLLALLKDPVKMPYFKDAMDTLYVPDVAKWAYDRIVKDKDASITFGNLNDTSAATRFKLTFTYATKLQGVGDYISVDYETPTHPQTTLLIGPVNGMSQDEQINRIKAKIVESFGGITLIPKVGTLGISGYNLGTEATGRTRENVEVQVGDSTQKITVNSGLDLNQQEIDARAERQSVLSLYSENLRSLRSQVTNKSSQQQTALTQTKESINQQTSLWTSILESIQGIMSAIVKRRS